MTLHTLIGIIAYAIVLSLFGLALAYPFLKASSRANEQAERIYDAMTQKDTDDARNV